MLILIVLLKRSEKIYVFLEFRPSLRCIYETTHDKQIDTWIHKMKMAQNAF